MQHAIKENSWRREEIFECMSVRDWMRERERESEREGEGEREHREKGAQVCDQDIYTQNFQN